MLIFLRFKISDVSWWRVLDVFEKIIVDFYLGFQLIFFVFGGF